MRVTLLGHASVLVQMEATTVLMDPVFFDPFEEGTVVSCPSRTVNLDRLPPIDILVVSHRHPDHFDIASLRQLPRDCDVICPADPLVVHGLRGLGFERVHPVHPMGEIAGEGFELFPTRSEIRSIPEFGMVFRDSSGVFWNQVDSFLSPETIESVIGRFGRIDLLFAMYASQNFDFFEERATEFPFQTHRDNLENALRIAPRAVVPSSAGFRFAGGLDWLNPFLFPISRERFVRDIQALAPGTDAWEMNPGDMAEVQGQRVKHVKAGSDVATTDCDDSYRLRFDPTAPIPPLVDPNPDGRSVEELVAQARDLVIEPLRRHVVGEAGRQDRVVEAYRSMGVTYDMELILPDGTSESVRLELGDARNHAVHRIAASALLDWVSNRKSFFYVRGWSRRSQVSYRLERTEQGVGCRRVPLPDLLMHYVINVAPGSELAAKHHLERLLAG